MDMAVARAASGRGAKVIWKALSMRHAEFCRVLAFHAKTRLGIDISEAFARDTAKFKKAVIAVYGEDVWGLFLYTLRSVLQALARQGVLAREEAEAFYRRFERA